MSKLAGKVAVVTGGGRGIGAAVVRELAEAGATVVAAARSQGEVERVAAELMAEGRRVYGLPCDVTDPAQVHELARQVHELVGPVAILVNNAGIASSAPLKGTTLEEWERIFAVNVTGTFLCSRELMPDLLAAGWGRVVNVASIAGLSGAPYIAAYAASKHAVIGLTRSLAAEVASRGVTVNAVCPGYVDTPMTEQSVARIVERTGRSADEVRGTLHRLSPQNRLFTPEEVAYAVVCLCDPRAGGINGQALVIDGGALLA